MGRPRLAPRCSCLVSLGAGAPRLNDVAVELRLQGAVPWLLPEPNLSEQLVEESLLEFVCAAGGDVLPILGPLEGTSPWPL